MENYWTSEESFYEMDPQSSAFLGDITLLKKKTNLELSSKNSQGWTSLMYASCKGWSHVVQYLLERRSFQEDRDSHGRTCLMLAIGSGDLSIVKLLSNADNIDYTDGRGWTALFYAVWFRREACTAYLLACGADPLVLDFEGESPKGLAEKSGIESLIALFKKSDALPDFKRSEINILDTAQWQNSPNIHIVHRQTNSARKESLSTKFIMKRKNKFSPNAKSIGQKENMSPHTPKPMNKIKFMKASTMSAPSKYTVSKVLNVSNSPLSSVEVHLDRPALTISRFGTSPRFGHTGSESAPCTPNSPLTLWKSTPLKIIPKKVLNFNTTPVSTEQDRLEKQAIEFPLRSDAQRNIFGTTVNGMVPRSIPHQTAINQASGQYNVQSFLKQLNLEKYWSLFRDEEVDFETLLTFEERNLNEIGINLYGPRQKIMAAIEEYKKSYGKVQLLLKNTAELQ